jgi:hypothetical protein
VDIVGGEVLIGERWILGEILVIMTHYAPILPNGLTWDRTQASAVRGGELTA